MSTLVLHPRIVVLTAVKGVEVSDGVKVNGTEVVDSVVFVAVTACVSVPVDVAVSEDMGVIEVLVGARGVTLDVVETGTGRTIGVALKMMGVEEGKGVEEIYGSGSTVQPLHPESIIENNTQTKATRFIFSSLFIFYPFPVTRQG